MDVIAVPLVSGVFCSHFGGAEQFLMYQVDRESVSVFGTSCLDAPPHKPGALPRWLSEQGVTTVLAGGMGDRARKMLSRLQIEVVGGVSGGNPDHLINRFLNGTLESGEAHCDGTAHGRLPGEDRGHGHHCGGGHHQ